MPIFKDFIIGKLLYKVNTKKVALKKSECKVQPEGEYILPARTATSANQGLSCYIPVDNATVLRNKISVSANAEFSAFWQDTDFTILQDSYALDSLGFELTKEIALYIIGCMYRALAPKYDWNNKSGWAKIQKEVITLPVRVENGTPVLEPNCSYHKDGYIPDFEYMERYIAELEQERIAELEQERIAELEQYLIATGLNDYTLTDEDKAVLSLIESRWGNEITDSKDVGTVPKQRFREFKVKDILKLEQTKAVVAKSNLLDGDIPYVTRTTSNNGYMGYCGNTDKINCGNCITIGAETAVAYYQPNDFVAGNKIYRLSHKDVSDKSYLFLVGLLNMYTHNYSYSNARIPARIKEETIMLPVNTNDEVDWSFMERYIRAIEKVVIADVVKYKDEVIAQTKALVNK